MIALEWSEEHRPELFTAYAKAQGEMGEVYKKSTNPAFKSQYADLSAVVDAVLPAMAKNDLAVIQSPSFDGEIVTVETIIAHKAGGWLRSVLSLRPMKADPQGVGSAITYGRRYALLSLSGTAPEDDDGNAASGPGQPGQRFTQELERPHEGDPVARKSSAQAKKDGDWDVILRELAEQRTFGELQAWAKSRSRMIKALPKKWFDEVEIKYLERKNELAAIEDNADAEGLEGASEAQTEMDEAFANTVGPSDFPGDRPAR
jgi:hypothetical protein